MDEPCSNIHTSRDRDQLYQLTSVVGEYLNAAVRTQCRTDEVGAVEFRSRTGGAHAPETSEAGWFGGIDNVTAAPIQEASTENRA